MNTTSKSDSVPVPVESVADMIERLGEPPEDIWDHLVAAAETSFPSMQASSPSSDSIRSPNHVFWQSHGVDAHGELIRLSEGDSATEAASATDPIVLDSADDALVGMVERNESAELASSGSRPKKTSTSKPIWVGVLAAMALLAAAFLWWPSSDSELAPTSDGSGGNVAPSSSNANVFAPGILETTEESALELGTLVDAAPSDVSAETSVDPSGIEMSAAEIVGANSVVRPSTGQPATEEANGMTSSAFSLDDLVPAPVATESSGGDDVGEVDESMAGELLASEGTGPASFGGGEEADVMSDGDTDDMDSDAVTGSTEESTAADSQTIFVSLPTLAETESEQGDRDQWPVSSWANARLVFPDKRLEFSVSGGTPDSGSVVRSSDQTAIANLRIDADENATRWEWLPGALDADRKALLHGRVELAGGQRVYLRPSLRGDAIGIDLADRDGKMKWDLAAPPEPKGARLSMDLVVPEGVDVGWIEPIENESPRKVRGIAVLSQQDSESVAVVVRVDVQTTRMMTVRVRFGARLDPSMPWQWTDREDVSQTLAVVTRQMELADRRHAELDSAISRAESSRARRLEARLEQQLDQLENQQKSLKMFAERLAELDQLIAMLAGQASLEAELFVSWPDDEQPILQLTSADG
ncbi:putative transmembrane protein [Rhodopirellula islandica]|uniref:Transmembrane protein n=1 Tax=Rhodopirellula islandica TaxID=595434 RepID=A0A0J1BJC5_RHOIS|nr:hypothetical protein [Rhodopirellula islandica]KLU06650.1 putative transmembrane protein [Rhodopirellula islandica]